MAPPPAAAVPRRKRTRKRKRRAASSSSESDSDSDSSSGSDAPAKPSAKTAQILAPSSSASSSSSSSDSSDSESSDSEHEQPAAQPTPKAKRARSPSLTPPPATIPTFAPAPGSEQETDLKASFRKFWMASIADAFKDDLDVLRKEPNLTAPRLALLVDSLASGADVFTSSAADAARFGHDTNEMQVVLDGQAEADA